MVQLVLDLFEMMHLWKMLQSSFHANNLTENEYVTASPAQDCCVIEQDWLAMLAKEDTADQSSIPALSRRQQKFQEKIGTSGKQSACCFIGEQTKDVEKK